MLWKAPTVSMRRRQERSSEAEKQALQRSSEGPEQTFAPYVGCARAALRRARTAARRSALMANDRNRYGNRNPGWDEDDGYIARRGFGNRSAGYDRNTGSGRSDDDYGR